MLERLAASLRARLEDLRPYEALEHVHQRRFAPTDARRFLRLWCEIAAICDVSPLKLHEGARVIELCPPTRTWRLVTPSRRFERLEGLLLEESYRRRPPRRELVTVADVLDHLLISDSGAPILDP